MKNSLKSIHQLNTNKVELIALKSNHQPIIVKYIAPQTVINSKQPKNILSLKKPTRYPIF